MNPKKKTVADYAVIAVAPLLVFLMLSSLANFLMLVIYRGGQPTKVSWTILCFTLGTVAVARLSIQRDRTYSLGYAVILGGVAFLAMMRFVSSGIASGLLLALVAYLSDWVIRDCTLIDENADSSDQGLMESGQFASLWKGVAKGKGDNGQPGRSVLYLAMAALPLYGIGQLFIRSGDSTWKRAQWLLVCYLFSAIALLVTTSFLGLRRYLRQRGADMPKQVSLAWLIGGMVLTALILMIATLAPIPGRTLASFELPAFLDSPGDTIASRFGWGDDGADDAGQDANPTGSDEQPEDKEIGSEASGRNAPKGKSETGNKEGAPAGKETGGKQQGGEESEKGSPTQPESGSDKGPGKSQPDPSAKKQAPKQETGEPGSAKDPEASSGQSSSSRQGKLDSEQSQSKEKAAAPNQRDTKGREPESPSPKQSNRADSQSDPKSQKSPSEDAPSNDQDPRSDRSDSNDKKASQSQRDKSENETSSDQERQPDQGEKDQPEQASDHQDDAESGTDSSKEQSGQDGQSGQDEPSSGSSRSNAKAAPPPPSAPDLAMPSGTSVLRAILFLSLIGLVSSYLWRHRSRLFALLASFSGRDADPSVQHELGQTHDSSIPSKPFSAYRHPGDGASSDEVIITVFNALIAWSREAGLPRASKETPNEFLIRFLSQFPLMQKNAGDVVGAYNRIVYGDGSATRQERSAGDALWQQMRQPAANPKKPDGETAFHLETPA